MYFEIHDVMNKNIETYGVHPTYFEKHNVVMQYEIIYITGPLHHASHNNKPNIIILTGYTL